MVVMGKLVGQLDQEQLFQLADRTWNKEARAMYHLDFDTERQRAQYLRQIRQSRDTVHRDLKSLDEQGKATEDVHLYRAINKIYNYTLLAYDFAYQYVVEPMLRAEYIGKISSHSKQMEQDAVAALGDRDRMSEIAHDAAWYRNIMMHDIETEQHAQACSFVQWMKTNQLKVEDIVKRFVAKLKFRGPFSKLTVVQKLQVWNEIIKESGKSTFEINRDLNSLGELGVTVLLITATIIVLDIFLADHKPARILKDGKNFLSSQINGVDGFAVDAMNIICWWGKLPDKYKPLPAEVVYGDKVVTGITAGEALSYAVGVTFLATGAIIIKGVTQAISSGGPTVINLEPETIFLQDLSGIGEEAAAEATGAAETAFAGAEAEAAFIDASEVAGLLEGELAGDLLAEEVLVGAAAVAPELAPVIIAVAVVVVIGFILFKIWKH